MRRVVIGRDDYLMTLEKGHHAPTAVVLRYVRDESRELSASDLTKMPFTEIEKTTDLSKSVALEFESDSAAQQFADMIQSAIDGAVNTSSER